MLYVRHRHTREVRMIPEGETKESREKALAAEAKLLQRKDSSGRRLWVPTGAHDPAVRAVTVPGQYPPNDGQAAAA